MSALHYTVQYSDYFNKSWRNESMAVANGSSPLPSSFAPGYLFNETYEIYAPSYPYVSSTEEQTYIDQLTEWMKNGSNHTYYGECSNTGYLPSLYFEITSYFLYVLIFVTAVIGNSIVLFIVQSNPRMRTVTNYFITNLAVGDLMMTLFCVPFTFISMFVLQYWPFGLGMCRLVNYTQAVSVLVSAYTLVAISGDRYIAIMWPLKPRITKTCSKVLIGVVWVIALITAAPIAIFSTLDMPSKWHAVCDLPICKEIWPSKEQESYYTDDAADDAVRDTAAGADLHVHPHRDSGLGQAAPRRGGKLPGPADGQVETKGCERVSSQKRVSFVRDEKRFSVVLCQAKPEEKRTICRVIDNSPDGIILSLTGDSLSLNPSQLNSAAASAAAQAAKENKMHDAYPGGCLEGGRFYDMIGSSFLAL
ncbi:hypothetical protein RP20_CCG021539 [Aedes albopictus]|nr:hypothetical protein RP20_CCG021539 [Aedes albopictus]